MKKKLQDLKELCSIGEHCHDDCNATLCEYIASRFRCNPALLTDIEIDMLSKELGDKDENTKV